MQRKVPKRLEKLEIYEVYAHFQGHTFHGHPLQYGLDMILIALLSSIQHLSILLFLRHIAEWDTGIRVSVLYLVLHSMLLIYDELLDIVTYV